MKMKADMFGMFIETLYIEIGKAHLECNYWNSDRGGFVIVDLRLTFKKYPTFKSCHRHTFLQTYTHELIPEHDISASINKLMMEYK